jgi:dethiobiotin synthetase
MHLYRSAGGVRHPSDPDREDARGATDPTGFSNKIAQLDSGSDTRLTPETRKTSGIRYWKPIQTGIEQDDDTAEVARLGECAPAEILDDGVRLERPLSPHLSARLSGRTITIDEVMRVIDGAPSGPSWVVEGAGGALVPINDREMMIDLMVRLALPVVVAARTALGTINHTLLTLEALRARALMVAGVVLVGDANEENRKAIAEYGRVEILGEMPRLTPLTPAALGAWARARLSAGALL